MSPARSVHRACEIHEALMEFFRREFPRDDPMMHLTACTYEIGRIVAVLGAALTPAEREELLAGVFEVMRYQVATGLRA